MARFALRLALALVLPLAVLAAPVADKVTNSQKAAALEYLDAVASGDPQAMAQAIHPDDLLALRLRLLGLMHEEAKKGDSTIRSRLFGQAMPMAEIDRLTNTGFYATLSFRLTPPGGREYSEVEGIAAVVEKPDLVQVLVRGKQPRERGKVLVVNVVTVRPYGKDWKATIPSEIQAQIDDLIEGRHIPVATARTGLAPVAGPAGSAGPAGGTGARPGTGTGPVQPGIVELLSAAEKDLADGKCEDYYGKRLSPNFRNVTSRKALQALISGCHNSLGTRTMLSSTLHIVRGLEPHYEYEGQRAVYDLQGQGLPFEQFVLEQVDKHWYVAE